MKKQEFYLPKCFFCERDCKMGPHIYDLKRLSYYDVFACHYCFNANHDGWSAHHESKLIASLKEKNIPIPERNEKGWFPRDLIKGK